MKIEKTFLILLNGNWKTKLIFFLICFWVLGPFSLLFAQTFTKITDTNNPIVTTPIDNNYSGAAWIDYNNDGLEDLFTTKTFLFKNEGNGNFSLVNSNIGEYQTTNLGNGTSWGDFDNDGDPDCLLAGSKILLYRNDGNDTFTTITDGAMGTDKDTRSWTCAWGDYNNDGFIDAIVTSPAGFVGTPWLPCFLFLSNDDGRFTRITDYEFTQSLAPYTVATWYDYDLDGDQDLFIASGPANGVGAPDYLYKNTFTETGQPGFERINDSPIATDIQNGQVWNFIDYDNDGDLDAFVTNYGGVNDHFYRNDNGTYVSVNNALVTSGQHLANSWGDLDNDGFLDVIVTSENGTTYFHNNGDGSFSQMTNGLTLSGHTRGVTLGDYDNDGKLDAFVSGFGSGKGLFHNDTQNGNNWVLINLIGTVSNKSAIGARLRAMATINGQSMWMMRNVSAQNSFDSQNSLRVHFGLGDAAQIDSLIIYWPSGEMKTLTNISSDSIYTYTEEIPAGFLRPNFKADSIAGTDSLTVHFTDLTLTDPNSPITSWEWDFNNDGVIDATDQNPVWTYQSPGSYSVSLKVTTSAATETKLRENYISVQNATGINNANVENFKFKLYQNYPNPFNPATKIKYSIPSGIKNGMTHVKLIVYNILGRQITTLVNEEKTPGNYEADFNGSKLSSGIYFYRIEAGAYKKTKQMVLIK